MPLAVSSMHSAQLLECMRRLQRPLGHVTALHLNAPSYKAYNLDMRDVIFFESRTLPHLVSLRMNGYNVRGLHLTSPTLKVLHLENCTLASQPVSHCNIHDLSLKYNDLSTNQWVLWEALISLYVECSSNNSLSLPDFTCCRMLKKLVLIGDAGNDLIDETPMRLDLSVHSELQNLEVRDLSLDVMGMVCSLHTAAPLTDCKLVGENLEAVQLAQLVEAKRTTLVVLEFICTSSEVCYTHLSFLRDMPHIRRIYISGVQIANADAPFLQGMPNLKSLSLSDCDISIDIIDDMRFDLCPSLTYLNIASNFIDSDEAIIRVAQRCPLLECLDVLGNDLNESQASSVRAALPGIRLLLEGGRMV